LVAIAQARATGSRLWLDVAGLADDAKLRELAELFGVHPLTLADLVNVSRQTRLESLDGISVMVTQFLQLDGEERAPNVVQLGLVLVGDVVLSFRERPGPVFDTILERLQRPSSRLRTEPLDYLVQALLDVAVDGAFPVVEALADRIDDIEDRILAGQGQNLMIEIHGQRRALITLGRLLWRQRDLLARLLREEQMFRSETRIHLRDIHDRSVQLLDLVETTRELAGSLVEMQLSISANRSNQIMKTLTIMASIFIPLTFIAGVYGMNFEWMPELGWKAAYPLVLLFMLGVALGLLLWFRRRGWLGEID
jgi:magnesium transporter